MNRAALLAAGVAAAACSHSAPAPGSTFVFPPAFDANQKVVLTTPDGAREMLASLRRRGSDFDVTLFDAAFAVPLLSASTRGGDVRLEGAPAAGLPEGAAAQLLALLTDLYPRTFRAAGADRFEARSRRFAFSLAGVPPGGSCAFPARIEVSPRRGTALHLRVDTLDVSCVAPPVGGE